VLANGSGRGVGSLAFSLRASNGDTALTEAMRITNVGNVGIGTTTPASRLDIFSGTGETNGLRIERSGWTSQFRVGSVGPTGSDFWLTNNYKVSTGVVDSATDSGADFVRMLGGGITFGTANLGAGIPQERMRIDGSGNVGIGTSTPDQKLVVNGNLKVVLDSANSTGKNVASITSLGISGITGARNWTIRGAYQYASGINVNADGGDLDLIKSMDGNIVLGTKTDGTGLGNVGVGTTSPFAKLDVVGTNNFTVPLFQLSSVASFATTTRFIVTNAGNVGIGTTTPAAPLSILSSSGINTGFGFAQSQIYSSQNETGFTLANTGTGGRSYNIISTNNSSGIGGGRFSIGDTAVGARFTIDSTGNVGIGTTTPGTALAVTGSAVFTGTTTFPTFNATSTTATSTIQGFLDVLGTGTNSTSTYASNLWVKGTLRTGTGSMYLNDLGLTSSDGNISLQRNGASSLSGGNFGVGTSTPRQRLTVTAGNAANVDDGMLISRLDLTTFGFRLKSNAAGYYRGAITFQQNFGTSDTEVMSFAPEVNGVNSNVGIGTTTPSSKLEVNGDIRLTTGSGGQIIFADGSTMSTAGLGSASALSNTTDAIVTGDSDANASGGILLKTGSNTRLTILNGGNVGIGTTTPQGNLAVVASTGGSKLILGSSDGGANSEGLEFRTSFGATVQANKILSSITSSPDATSGGRLIFNTTAIASGVLTERMRIDANGQFMIGTTTPQGTNPLTIKISNIGDGFVVVGNTTGTLSPQFSLNDQGTQKGAFGLALSTGHYSSIAVPNDVIVRSLQSGGSGGNLILSAQSTGSNILFTTGPTGGSDTQKMVLTNAGNLGVGTTSPMTTLSVQSATVTNAPAAPALNTPTITYDAIFGNGTYNYIAIGYTHSVRVYSYKLINGIKIFSAAPNTSSTITDNSGGNDYYVNFSWSSVAGVDGYRIFKSDTSNPFSYNAYYDTTATSIKDGDGSMSWTSGTLSTPFAMYGDAMQINGNSTTTGFVNTGIGYNINGQNALRFDFGNSFVVGNTANATSTGSNNFFVGNTSSGITNGTAGRNTTGSFNNFIGAATGALNTTGSNNNFFGLSAGSANTTGSENNFIGHNTGISNTTGNYNNFIGFASGGANATGSQNTFVGQGVATNSHGDANTALGYGAGVSLQYGSNNLFLGANAGGGLTSSLLNNASAIGANANIGLSNAMSIGGTGSNAVYVGLGTTTPNWALQIASTTPAFAITDTNAAVNSKHWLISNNDGKFNIGTSSDSLISTSTYFTINGSGYVGIGTSTPWGSLSVNPNNLAAGMPEFVVGSAAGTNFLVDSSGKVGIGTAVPKATLDFGINSTPAKPFWLMYNDNAGINMGIWRDTPASNVSSWVTNANGQIAFGKSTSAATPTFGSEFARFDNNGNFGIATSAPSNTLTVVGSACFSQGAGTASVACGTTPGNIYYKTNNAGNYDVAENYTTSDSTVGAGDIVSIDTLAATSTIITKASTGSHILGIVSTDPGMVLGGADANVAYSSSTRPVALSGRVPVKVNGENGNISTGDKISLSSTVGVGKKASGSEEIVGIALESWSGGPLDQGLITVFVSNKTSVDQNQFSVDASGNVGIGTTSPMYKLQVNGDVAAQSFVNISTRSAKHNITYVDDSGKLSMLAKLRAVGVATYHYNSDPDTAPLRMGLIAEEAPTEVLADTGKGVDIYKLSTFILAGVQEMAKKIDDLDSKLAVNTSDIATLQSTVANLQSRIDAMSSSVATGTNATTTATSTQTVTWSSDFTAQLLSFLETAGLKLANGIAYIENAVVNTFSANIAYIKNATIDSASVSALTVGTAEKRSGITLYDQLTGEPYCLKIAGGQTQTTPGQCPLAATSTPAVIAPAPGVSGSLVGPNQGAGSTGGSSVPQATQPSSISTGNGTASTTDPMTATPDTNASSTPSVTPDTGTTTPTVAIVDTTASSTTP
jgi:hypothetical protein